MEFAQCGKISEPSLLFMIISDEVLLLKKRIQHDNDQRFHQDQQEWIFQRPSALSYPHLHRQSSEQTDHFTNHSPVTDC